MAKRPPSDEFPAWIDRVVAVSTSLGMNPVRVRWRLQRRVNQWRAMQRRGERRLGQVRYDHRVCPHCTAVNDRDQSTCHRCETSLSARPFELARRVGLGVPVVASASALIGIAIVAVYARTALIGGNVMAIPSPVLVAFGSNLPADAGGEWWRTATSVLLHADVLHLGFNLLSLARVGPMVEDLYGRGALLVLFLITGIAASIGTVQLGLDGVGIGASGAIMGLIGVAGAAGHRAGTGRGREIRNAMLRWAAVVVVFSAMVGADHRAHGVGLASGITIGLVLEPRWLAPGRRRGRIAATVLGVIGGLALVATTIAALVPLSTTSVGTAVASEYTQPPSRGGGLLPGYEPVALRSANDPPSDDPGDLDDVGMQVFLCDTRIGQDPETRADFGDEEMVAAACQRLQFHRRNCAGVPDTTPSPYEPLLARRCRLLRKADAWAVGR